MTRNPGQYSAPVPPMDDESSRGFRYTLARLGERAVIVLEIEQGSTTGRVFELDQPAVMIGRAETNHVILPDYHLSGEHGQLFCEDDQYIYRDLRSTNGSALQRGERRITVDAACQYEITVHDGDRLLLGDPKAPVVLALRLGAAAAEPDDAGSERGLAARPIARLPGGAGRVRRGGRPRAGAPPRRCAPAGPSCAACSPSAPPCSSPTPPRSSAAPSRSWVAASCRPWRCRCGTATRSAA